VNKPLPVGASVVYRAGWPGTGPGVLVSFDGATVKQLGTVQDHAVADGDLWTLLADGTVTRASQPVTTAPANARSLAVLDGVLYVGTADSHLWAYH
jgi:hypothetical protein